MAHLRAAAASLAVAALLAPSACDGGKGSTDPSTNRPVIALSSTSAAFSTLEDSANPAQVIIDVQSGGTAAVQLLVVDPPTYGAGASGWLHAGVDASSAPAQLAVTASTAGVPPGSWSASFVIKASGATPVTVSAQVVVRPLPPVALFVATNPDGITSGVALTTQPVVTLTNRSGRRAVGSTALVQAIISGGRGQLSGTTIVSAVDGTARFTNLVVTGGGDQVMRFAAAGLDSATARTFTITRGFPTQLKIATQPLGSVSGQLLAVQPVVQLLDASGQLVTSGSYAVVASVAAGRGVVRNQVSVLSSNGVARFSALAVAGAGPVSLQFSTATDVVSVSNTFDLTSGFPASAQLVPRVVSVDSASTTSFGMSQRDGTGAFVYEPVAWQSGDSTMATFDASGRLTTKRSGSLWIYARVRDFPTIIDSLHLAVVRAGQVFLYVSPADRYEMPADTVFNFDVVVDMRRAGVSLGSLDYEASWDPAVFTRLSHAAYSIGVSAQDSSAVAQGRVRSATASTSGAANSFVIFRASLRTASVRGAVGTLRVTVREIWSAGTFVNLMPVTWQLSVTVRIR